MLRWAKLVAATSGHFKSFYQNHKIKHSTQGKLN